MEEYYNLHHNLEKVRNEYHLDKIIYDLKDKNLFLYHEGEEGYRCLYYNIRVNNNNNGYKVNFIEYNILGKNDRDEFNQFFLYKKMDNIYYSIHDMIYEFKNIYYGLYNNIIYKNIIGAYFINKLIGWIKFEANKGIICKNGYDIDFKNKLRDKIDRNKVIIEYNFRDNSFTIYYDIIKDSDSYICDRINLRLSQTIAYDCMINHYRVHLDTGDIIEKVDYVYENSIIFKHERIGIIIVNANEFFINGMNKFLEYNRFINIGILS